ncbi:hypothetical protein [Bacillus sp. SG-1]|uniref:hypothetical protein n=1 Tax=Bacillus sp. SG-1 TaxID=161544 RepID=UPI0001543CAD|nr:hypothetical protein [Bacillus sp. SG-1]EDL66594.1 hypothetical protein BSG1_04540 [Bacillus sp. SG-1]
MKLPELGIRQIIKDKSSKNHQQQFILICLKKKRGIILKNYLGMVSILILIATYTLLQSLVGKYIGHWWVVIIVIGFVASALASWYSKSGFWRKASATILIALPVGYLIILALFIFGLSGF